MHNSNLEKIYGFDYLRAICCIVVVAIHAGIGSLFFSYKSLFNLIEYNIFDLAVPIFFQISLILFFFSREKQKDYFWKKRFFKIIKLYIFWGIFSQAYFLVINEISLNQLINFTDIIKLIVFLMTDGYYNPFYFFFSLLFLTTLAEFFASYLEKTKISNELICYYGFIFSCIIVLILPLIVIFLGKEFALITQAFNPINFTPYIFSSFLMKNEISQNQRNNNVVLNTKNLFILLILFVVFAIFEWKYLDYPLLWGGFREDSLPVDPEDALPVYSRLSLVFGAWLITLISLKITSEPHFIVKLFSDLSLGIYCLHTLFGILLWRIVTPQPYGVILIFFITLLLSTVLTKFLKGFKIFKDLV